MTTDIRKNVMAFHEAAQMTDPKTPVVPSDAKVRLRARLLAEEFFETIEAMFQTETDMLTSISDKLSIIVEHAPVSVDLVGMADGLADLDYISEGTRLAFGIDGGPIAAEVQRSNLDKFRDGVKRRPDGKVIKPEGWTPPDIKNELIKQGWLPPKE